MTPRADSRTARRRLRCGQGPRGTGRFHEELSQDALRAEINELLVSADGALVVDHHGHVVAAADPHIDEEVLKPALAMLAQPRLARVAQDFAAATSGLAAGTPESNERAIAEASNAVEGMLAVIMDERGVTAHGDATHARFKALCGAGILPAYQEALVCAPSRIRNKTASHSRESTPRDADDNVARSSVQAAAVALLFLDGVRQPR